MDGYHNKFVNLLSCCMGRCCNGRREKEETVELTPQRNTYERKLMINLDNKERRNVTKITQADASKPLPSLPPGRASLDLAKSRRPSADLADLMGSDNDEPSDAQPVHGRAWYEMLSSLHNALKHTRYSISGRMGMSVWGCANGARTALSVICPIESKEPVKLWCISTGSRFSLTEAEPDILSYQAPGTPQHPSSTWRIRIRWLREATFDAMPKVEMAPRYDDGNPYAGEQVAVVNVLTLPGLLDNCACTWGDHLHRHGRKDSRLRGLEEDVFSILERMIDLDFSEEGAGPLTEHECCHVIRESFWVPFTRRHRDSPAMFALCGLPIPQTPGQKQQPTAAQSPTNGEMAYPSSDTRFSNPRPAPAVPPKDSGRDFTSTVMKRKSDEQPRRTAFLELFTTNRRDSKERERRTSADARKLEEEVRRGVLRLDKRERKRRSHQQHRRGASDSSTGSEGGSTTARRQRSSREEGRSSKDAMERVRGDVDRERRRGSDPGALRPPAPREAAPRVVSSGARVDGTKVSEWDPSALEQSASGSGRIPQRGYFADLFIVDDGDDL